MIKGAWIGLVVMEYVNGQMDYVNQLKVVIR
jgi:hypothetical protein